MPKAIAAVAGDALVMVVGERFTLPGHRGQGGGRIGLTCDPLEVISFGESAIADEGAGDAGEGEEVVGLAFVA
ncbi:hypothetical protein ACF09J_31890, partial [Streptomyces sp. NPDC014889]|uniref:hypothetical protein n=1 Tax=Streptomyces sp. NPDC014889 TaxID=3364928 RepID=UPI0036FAD9AE